MKVKEELLPNTELINNSLQQIDFTDTFSTTNHQDDLEKIANLIFASTPKWINFLLRTRNFIVKKMGLKTEVNPDDDLSFRVGGNIGFFEIFSIQENEILIGKDDKHLDFRVSILNSNEKEFNIKVSTLVQYNNFFGKLYMTIVKPFHHFMVKIMVKQAYKS